MSKTFLRAPKWSKNSLGTVLNPSLNLNLTLKNPWNLRFGAIFVYGSGLMLFRAKVGHWRAHSKARKGEKNVFLTSKISKTFLRVLKWSKNSLGTVLNPSLNLNLTLKNPWNLRFLAIFVYSSGLMPFGAKVSHWMALSKAHKISKNYFLTSKMWKIVLTPPKCPRNIQGTIPELSLGSNLRNPKSMSTVRCRGHDLTLPIMIFGKYTYSFSSWKQKKDQFPPKHLHLQKSRFVKFWLKK